MGKLVFDDIFYRVDGQRLEPGMTIRRYDPIAETWIEGEVGRISGYDHKHQQRIYTLCLVVEGYAPSPLVDGDMIEIIIEAERYNRAMDERNRMLQSSREKPWLPSYDGE